MYVCICNGLTEKHVKATAQELGEHGCARTVYKHMGCKVQCGLCLPFAKHVISKDVPENSPQSDMGDTVPA